MFDVGLGTLVTYNPTALSMDATLDTVVRLFTRDVIRHLPVVDSERRVVGIVSALDVENACRAASITAESTGEIPFLVRDLMKSPVVTVDQNDSPLTVLNVLLTNRIHSVPVVANEQLVGIVTSSDFLRELSYGDDPLSREPASRYLQSAQAQVKLSDSIQDARAVMDRYEVDFVPVTNGALPMGLLGRRDLAALPDGQESATVEERYTADVPSVKPADRLADVVRLMLEKRAHAVLVLERGQKLRGLLSQNIVLGAILHALSEAAVCP